MTFFDDFSKSASVIFGKAAKNVEAATKTAVRKSSDFAEVSKLKMKISAEDKAVDDLYYAIGKKVYEDCAESGIVPESVQGECDSIYEHKARIAELKGKIELVRGGNQGVSTEDESEVVFTEAEETVVEGEAVAADEIVIDDTAAVEAQEAQGAEEVKFTDISETIKEKEDRTI